LITSPGRSVSAAQVSSLVSKCGWLSALMMVMGGAVFLCVMPHHQFSHKTYFSENALLPGLVKNDFDQDLAAHLYLEKMREEAASHGDYSMDLLHGFLSDMGLEVYTHNFTLNFPFGKGKVFKGQNLYAILRAPRASSTEALVLSAPFRRSVSLEPANDVAIALLLASAKFFRTQNYWAKDIVFLITEHEMLGMQAWLEAYHQTSSGMPGVIDRGELEARAGAIQAAINLEIGAEKITHVNVKIQGLNGQLPNLDLVNLIHRLCMKEGVGQLFQNSEDLSHKVNGQSTPDSLREFLGPWKVYTSSFRTLMSMMMGQASGNPDGNHGLFHRMGIEAVTLEGVDMNVKVKNANANAAATNTNKKKKKKKYLRTVDLYQMGRIVEGTFRSLNNLLERFHQSFFYYVLPSTSRYVSIGMYMPGFGLVAASLVVSALGLWWQSLDNNLNGNGNAGSPRMPLPDVFRKALPIFVASHLLGYLAWNVPLPASNLAANYLQWNVHYQEVVLYGLAAVSALGILWPLLTKPVNAGNYHIVKCLTLLELAVVSFTVSLSNFSLSFVTTAFVIGPLALMASPGGLVKRALMSLAMLLAHPLTLTLLLCLVDTYRIGEIGGGDMSAAKVFVKGYQSAKHGLMYSVIDGYIYGNVTYALCCLSYLPLWTLLWTITHAKPTQQQPNES